MDFFSGDPIALWVTLTASIVGSPLDARRTRDSRSFARSSPRAPGGSAASSAPARSSFAWKATATGLSSSTTARATGTRADASTGRAVVCAGQGAKIHGIPRVTAFSRERISGRKFQTFSRNPLSGFEAKSSEILATSVLQIRQFQQSKLLKICVVQIHNMHLGEGKNRVSCTFWRGQDPYYASQDPYYASR
jgi:hypothetical protein